MTTQAFKPSVRAYAKNTLAIGGLGIPVLGLLFVTSSDKKLLVGAMAIAFVGSLSGVLLYIAWARVYVTPDAIGKRGFGPTKWTPRAAVSRGLFVRNLKAGTGSPTHLFLFAPDSALVMRLYGAIWGAEQLQQLGDVLGIEVAVYSSIDAAELHKLEPTALNWAERNPKDMTIVVFGVFAVIAVIVFVVVFALR